MNNTFKYLAPVFMACTFNAYADSANNVIEVYNDCPSPCCSMSNNVYLSGLYLEANLGSSWFNMDLHRPPALDLPPLSNGEVRTNNWSFAPAIGFDFYPTARIPLRFEFNYLYCDNKFGLNPLFDEDIAPGFRADDNLRVYTTMFAAYIDWRNCTRFIPFIGVGYGWTNIKTTHSPVDTALADSPGSFRTSKNDAVWGGSFGTRFMFSCHFYGNLQVRFTNMKAAHFRNPASLVPLPGDDDYLSDYVHETSVLVGLAYEF